ncbi:hypothetical protein KQX54_002725 [Cotesia glomerata]|uniref:Uncharacterized protein n=1 Tax=Cotesia glomerata TaxID=32391 RepID=A0AAV7IT42_COTGL|nr:hypothetical protein KQX54_002725 [Cotesia glomerata]
MKLLIILLMNIYLAKSSEDQVLIHGPNTPVYKCKLVNGHVKVETVRQKFDNKAAKYSYDEAIHPKLLVVVDYKDYSKDGEQKSLDNVVETIESINIDYEFERDVYLPPSTFGVNISPSVCLPSNYGGRCFTHWLCWTRSPWDYASSESELKRFSNWFKITAEQFEDSDYDAFIYSFPGYLAGGNPWERKAVWSLSSGTVCKSKPGAIVTNRLGLTHNEDKLDSHWYTYEEHDVIFKLDRIIDWKNQTAGIIKDNYRRGKYSCLKKPVKKNDDYDYE